MFKFIGKHAAIGFGAGAGKAAMDHTVRHVMGLGNRKGRRARPPTAVFYDPASHRTAFAYSDGDVAFGRGSPKSFVPVGSVIAKDRARQHKLMVGWVYRNEDPRGKQRGRKGQRYRREINPYSKRYTYAGFKRRYFKGEAVPDQIAKEFWSDFRYAFNGGLQRYIKETKGLTNRLRAARGRTAPFGQVYGPRADEVVSPAMLKANPEMYEEAFGLIERTYKPIGGHLKIQRPGDIRQYDYTRLRDIEGSPAPDIVNLGKHTPYGIKMSASGTTGTKGAKGMYIATRVQGLQEPGVYGEASDALAHVLLTRYRVPVVNNEAVVRQVLGKPIRWYGRHPEGKYPGAMGWYARRIGGKEKLKIMVGRPIVKGRRNCVCR